MICSTTLPTPTREKLMVGYPYNSEEKFQPSSESTGGGIEISFLISRESDSLDLF